MAGIPLMLQEARVPSEAELASSGTDKADALIAKLESSGRADKLIADLEAAKQADATVSEMSEHISKLERFVLQNLGTEKGKLAYFQQKRPDIEVKSVDGEIMVRKQGEPWKYLDEPGLSFQDISDVASDITIGAATVPSFAATLPAAGIGGAATAALGEGARQAAGRIFGIPENEDISDITMAGVGGAVAPYVGKTVGALGSKFLRGVSGVSEKAAAKIPTMYKELKELAEPEVKLSKVTDAINELSARKDKFVSDVKDLYGKALDREGEKVVSLGKAKRVIDKAEKDVLSRPISSPNEELLGSIQKLKEAFKIKLPISELNTKDKANAVSGMLSEMSDGLLSVGDNKAAAQARNLRAAIARNPEYVNTNKPYISKVLGDDYEKTIVTKFAGNTEKAKYANAVKENINALETFVDDIGNVKSRLAPAEKQLKGLAGKTQAAIKSNLPEDMKFASDKYKGMTKVLGAWEELLGKKDMGVSVPGKAVSTLSKIFKDDETLSAAAKSNLLKKVEKSVTPKDSKARIHVLSDLAENISAAEQIFGGKDKVYLYTPTNVGTALSAIRSAARPGAVQLMRVTGKKELMQPAKAAISALAINLGQSLAGQDEEEIKNNQAYIEGAVK